ncbi:hypothetical protein ACLOJK_016617 [Asimina triloba]
MSSAVCQGLQTCLEPGLLEHRATALRLVSPKPHLFPRTEPPAAAPAASIALSAPNTAEQQCRHNNITDSRDLGTFASIFSLKQTSTRTHAVQSLRTTSSLPATSLTKMSLELCTENLGCETGTVLTNTDFSSHASSSSNPNSPKPSMPQERAKLRRSLTNRKENPGPFPPPLTSISGQSSIHMKPHREGGRLILKAVTVPSAHACLQAERSDGRLRLRLVSRNPPTEATVDGDEKVGEEDEGKMSDNISTPTHAETKGGEEQGGSGSGSGSSSSRPVCLGERRNEKDERGEIGIGKYQRPGRCKEGGHRNKGLLNWEPFWVASS